MSPYADHRDAQNFAGRPPRPWWKDLGISILIAIILGGGAIAIGIWHGHTQVDIATEYSERR